MCACNCWAFWLRGQPGSHASLPAAQHQPPHAPACLQLPSRRQPDSCACLPRPTRLPSVPAVPLQLWAIGTEGDLRPLRTFAKAPVPISTITLHPSGRALLVALSDGGLSLYSTQDLAVVYSHSHEGPIKQAEFMNTDDVFLVSGSKVRAAGDHEQICRRFQHSAAEWVVQRRCSTGQIAVQCMESGS